MNFLGQEKRNRTTTDWELWRSNLTHMIDNMEEGDKVGEWQDNDDPKWLFSPQEHSLYQHNEAHWLRYSSLCQGRNGYYKITGTKAPNSPIHSAYVSRFKDWWVCNGYNAVHYRKPIAPKTLQEYAQLLPASK
jgi:hypothetical protein